MSFASDSQPPPRTVPALSSTTGAGRLVLCAKSGDVELWTSLMREHRRSDSLVLLGTDREGESVSG